MPGNWPERGRIRRPGTYRTYTLLESTCAISGVGDGGKKTGNEWTWR